jgi:hypothetical protein
MGYLKGCYCDKTDYDDVHYRISLEPLGNLFLLDTFLLMAFF